MIIAIERMIIMKKGKIIKLVASCTLVTALSSNITYKMYQNNPYLLKDIQNYNGQVIDDNIENEVLSAYQLYCKKFPNFENDFKEKIKTAKIYKTSYDNYQKSAIKYSVFYPQHNRLLITNNNEITYELGNLLSYDNETDNIGFATSDGYGESLNDGFITNLWNNNKPNGHSDKEIIFCASHGVYNIIANIIGQDIMSDIYFSGNKNIDNVINLFQDETNCSNQINNLIQQLDSLNNKIIEYSSKENYKRLLNDYNLQQENINDLSGINELTIKINEQLLLILIPYLLKQINNNQLSYDDYLWYKEQISLINSYTNIDINTVTGYNEFIELEDKINKYQKCY